MARLNKATIAAIDAWAVELARQHVPGLDRPDDVLVRIGEGWVWLEYNRLAARGTVKGRKAPATTDMLHRWLKRRVRRFALPSTYYATGGRLP